MSTQTQFKLPILSVQNFASMINLPENLPTLPCPKSITLYRIILNVSESWITDYYMNVALDRVFFEKRIYIIYSDAFVSENAKAFLKYLYLIPGNIIKDLSNCKQGEKSCIDFLLDGHYNDPLTNNMKILIDFYMQKRMYRFLELEVTSLLFLHKTEMIVLDIKIPLFKPQDRPFVSIEQSLYDAAICKKTGLMKLSTTQYEMYANLSDKPLVERSYFDTKTVLDLTYEIIKATQRTPISDLIYTLWLINNSNIPPIDLKHAPITPVLYCDEYHWLPKEQHSQKDLFKYMYLQTKVDI